MKIPYFNREAALDRAILRLKDSIWWHERRENSKYTPSEMADSLRKIYRRAGTVDRLGGDSAHMIPDAIKKQMQENFFV